MNNADKQSVICLRPPFVAATLWAIVGAGFVALYVYLMLRWIAGPNFVPVPAGLDIPPPWMKTFARCIEIVTPTLFTWTFHRYVYKPWRRDGELSHDGLMVLALITLYWQNALPNYIVVDTLMSSVFINFGSWYQYVPGWISPNMNRMPEAPLAWGLCYSCWFVFYPMKAGAKFIRWLETRNPDLSAVKATLVAYVGFILLDFALEGIFLRTGMYSYAGAVHRITLFAGNFYQFPVSEIVTFGGVWALYAALYAFRDNQGMTLVERNVERLHIGSKGRKAVRFLALVAVFNAIFLVQNTIMIMHAPHGDAWPTLPSYLNNGLCGPATTFDCPGPGVPIATQSARSNRTTLQ